MKAVCFIFLFLFCSLSSYAQVIGFEEKVPETFKVSGKGEVKLSSLFYKEGESSLEWDLRKQSGMGFPTCLDTGRSDRTFIAECQKGTAIWYYPVDI